MKKFKFVLSLILSVIMALSVAPISAFALGETGVEHIGDYDSTEFGFVATYPSNFEGRYQLPVIIWSGGTGANAGSYKDLCTILAKDGYIVVTSTDNLLYDGTVPSKAIDFIIAQNDDETSPLYQKVDTNRIGAAGHSLGGRNSVNVAAKDSRVKAIVSIAGSNIESERVGITVPALYFAGEDDTIMSAEEWVLPMYYASQGPKVYASVKGASHVYIFENPNLYANYISTWFYTWLYDDQETREYFVEGGQLSKDSKFMNYMSENFESEYTTNPQYTIPAEVSNKPQNQTNSTIEKVAIFLMLAIIVVLIAFAIKRRNK